MDLVNSKIGQGPDEIQPGIGIWKFGGGVPGTEKVVLKREMSLKCHLLLSFAQGWPCLWSVLIAAGGESTENKNKPVFPGFCHFASLPSRQTLLTDLTISSRWNDSQALSGSM